MPSNPPPAAAFHAADKEDVDPFALIEKGNCMESCGNLWSAADSFGRASVVLRRQAEQARADAQSHLNDTVDGDGGGLAEKNKFHKRIKMAVERDRVATLFADQSREYLYRARAVLLRALEFENDEDRRRAKDAYADQQKMGNEESIKIDPKVLHAQFDPLVMMISEEEGQRRRKIFERIYSVPLNDVPVVEEVVPESKNKREEQEKEQQINAKNITEETKQDSKEEGANEMGETNKAAKEDGENEVALEIPQAPGSSDETEKATAEGKSDGTEKVQLDEKQLSLEERLADFESTIPSEFKSEKERVSDIHKGMGRLGLNLPTSPDIARHIIHAKPPSEEEQIRLLVEQAKDAARLEGHGMDNIPAEAAEAAEAGGVDAGDDILAINNEDDLASILKKTHLELSGNGPRPSIAEAFKNSFKAKDVANDLADRGALLNLISTAQELLFEASAYLEDSDDLSEQGEEEEELGLDRDSALEDKCMKQGKASIVEAKKCVEKILRSWPSC